MKNFQKAFLVLSFLLTTLSVFAAPPLAPVDSSIVWTLLASGMGLVLFAKKKKK